MIVHHSTPAQEQPKWHLSVSFQPPQAHLNQLESEENQKKATITNKTDEEVWDLSDETIIGTCTHIGIINSYSDVTISEAHKKTWHSPEYDHYSVSLRQREPPKVSTKTMDLVFTCNYNPHDVVYRSCMGTAQGTTNLKNSWLSCEIKQRESSGMSRGTSTAPASTIRDPSSFSTSATSTSPTILYSEKLHRVLIALRCAWNYRPFNFMKDPKYVLKVEILQPGTKIPHPSTGSNDVQALHTFAAQHVCSYFFDFDRVVHCAMDAWSLPLVASYLRVVISWWQDGKLRRATLDFLKYVWSVALLVCCKLICLIKIESKSYRSVSSQDCLSNL